MDIRAVSIERIEGEFHKLMLRSHSPSRGIRWLQTINRLQEILPEIAATRGIVQEPRWHPEGDVFEHSMQALDAAARLSYEHDHERLVVTYAALCHDIGKVSTTETIEGVIRSYGHAQVGAKLSKKLLHRITHNNDLINAVYKLVYYHMDPLHLVDVGAKLGAYKRMARRLAPEVTLATMAQLLYADRFGRNPDGHEPLHERVPEIEQFIAQAELAQVLDSIEKPILLGRDLLDVMKPGPAMGALLKKAYEIQIDEGIQDKELLKRRVLEK